MDKDPFKEYIRQSEPSKRDKGYAWHTAIGLQAVDGLKPSKYLIDTAIKNIEGDISIDEAQELLNTYYEENPKADTDDRTEEADKVAVRIAKILSEKAFSFTPNEYISIHKKLFAGIYGHAGKLRDYNITKKEWVLNGATVLYGSASELRATLDYDFAEEKKFSYKNLSMEEIIHHLAFFVSRLWQIHVFGEGNTRTTAVFFIKYIGSLKSEVYFCCYEKNYEQYAKLGVPIEEAPIKNRFEIRLKDERAYYAVRELLTHYDAEQTAFSIINHYIRFVDREPEKRKTDWKLNERWAWFIGKDRPPIKLTTDPEPYTLERTLGWISRQVAPTLKMLKKIDAGNSTSYLKEIEDNAKLTEKHLQIIRQQTADTEELITE